nr:PREDICTED: T-cell surface glycoprotein CD3 epsilon chain-like [Austrofundulus limnaeus]
MGVQIEFVVFLMFAVGVKSEGSATFWRDKVTLTCPGNGTWHSSTAKVQNEKETYEFEFTKKKNNFHCTYQDIDDVVKTYRFYVEGKACKDCFEVDGLLFLLIIIVDLIGTSALMTIIYSYTKKKVPEQRPQPRPKPGGRAPPVPAADYEQLSPNSESATYSAVVIRQT